MTGSAAATSSPSAGDLGAIQPAASGDAQTRERSAEAFYVDLGEGRFASTSATAGPWSPKAQHAGPPSALLGRTLERCDPRSELRIARMTLDIARPIPVGDLQVEARVVRAGARTELLEGVVTADGVVVLLARAWRLASSPTDSQELRPTPSPPPLPDAGPPPGMAGAHWDGYLSAIEWRFAVGGFEIPGPGACWVRQRIPLLADEQPSPLCRALTVADSSWAVGFELDYVRQLVINTDVTLALHRDPVGEWLCMRSETAASPAGSGLAHGQLADADGDVGHILQTLLVAPR